MLPQEKIQIRGPRRTIQTIAGVAGGHLHLVSTVAVIAQRHGALSAAKFGGHIQKRLIC